MRKLQIFKMHRIRTMPGMPATRQQTRRIASMFESDFERDTRPLVGISVSAVSLLALACLAAFLLIFLGMSYVGALLGGNHKGIGWIVGTGFITLGGGALCILTLWAWKALYAERRWALWIARSWAALLMLLGGLDLYHLHQPHTPAPDEYFGLVYDPLLLITGSVWLLYLWLPKVRERFRSRQPSAE